MAGDYIPIKASGCEKVQEIKKRVKVALGVPEEDQILTYSGTKLASQSSLNDYRIAMGSIIHLNYENYAGNNQGFINLTFYVKHNQQLLLSYNAEKDKRVRDLMKKYVKNSNKNSCLLYGKVILKPHQRLRDIESEPSFR